MDWLTALAIVTISAGTTISVVVLAAVGSIRRSLNEGSSRQAQQVRRMADSITVLNGQLQEAQARIQALGEANRRLAEELQALGERVGDADGDVRRGSAARLLH